MTSDNTRPWLRAEIAQWLREGLISDEQARCLLERYPNTPQALEYGGSRGVFASLGTVLFGMGIILLFAYNWSEIGRYGKLASIFLGFIFCHGLAALIKDPRVSASLHLLGSFLFGAGIWLIAQVYHVSVHYPDGFLVWAIAALMMSWVLPSLAHCLLACGLLAIWSTLEVLEFNDLHFGGLVALVVLQLPWAFWQRSEMALACILAVLPMTLLANSWYLDADAVLLHGGLLAALYLSAAQLAPRLPWSGSGPVFRQLGGILWLLTMLIFSFSNMQDVVAGFAGVDSAAARLTWGMLALIVVSWSWIFLDKSLRPRGSAAGLESALLLLPLVLLALVSAGYAVEWLLVAAANLSVLGYGLLYIVRGSSLLSRRQLALGCGLVIVLAGLRFTDLFESLLARAGVFLLLGALLFLAGLRFARQKQRRLQEQRHV